MPAASASPCNCSAVTWRSPLWCCGMPQLEQGDLAAVAASAKEVAASLGPWIDKGYDIVALVPSCALMLKFEWPLIVPNDAAIEKLATATYDISEYVVAIAKG